jgi:hypothetical protein
MTDRFTPVMRALVAATLLLATLTLMLVTMNAARAAGALAIGSCGAFGEAAGIDAARPPTAARSASSEHSSATPKADFARAKPIPLI